MTVECAWCGAEVNYVTCGSCSRCGRDFCDMCLTVFHICDGELARSFLERADTTTVQFDREPIA